MSAVLKPIAFYIRPMNDMDLEAVMAIETRTYEYPWTTQIFMDCLHVGYCCWTMEHRSTVVSYGIMSVGSGDSHLLNLCVSPDYRSQGLGKKLLSYLLDVAKGHSANISFLEVRPSNFAAIRLCLSLGFHQIGVRHGYYPTKLGREDALIFARTAILPDNKNKYV